MPLRGPPDGRYGGPESPGQPSRERVDPGKADTAPKAAPGFRVGRPGDLPAALGSTGRPGGLPAALGSTGRPGGLPGGVYEGGQAVGDGLQAEVVGVLRVIV